MIPLWMTLRVRCGDGTNIRLGLPLFLIWLLLLPIAVLAIPVVLAVMLFSRCNPLAMIAAGWSVLNAMRGTHVDVAAPASRIFIHVY